MNLLCPSTRHRPGSFRSEEVNPPCRSTASRATREGREPWRGKRHEGGRSTYTSSYFESLRSSTWINHGFAPRVPGSDGYYDRRPTFRINCPRWGLLDSRCRDVAKWCSNFVGGGIHLQVSREKRGRHGHVGENLNLLSSSVAKYLDMYFFFFLK